MTASRTSPLETTWRAVAKQCRAQSGMAVPERCDDRPVELDRLARLGIADVSGLPRFTVKGPSAADAVAAAGLPVPDAWFEPVATGPWSFVARTGRSEFWIEGALGHELQPPPVALIFARQDGSLLLAGSGLWALLAEVLAAPIEPLDPDRGRLHFVQIARVGCALMLRPGRAPAAQIWVDPTYAPYLGEVLHDLGQELGGGWVGVEVFEGERLLPRTPAPADGT
ncbi:MAG TPA: hypothetical protein VH044_19800 [Polyangiaceae bacterium]|jgi:hypothetical protein|nr:hypothetical protein [Polyangiaceae bacterium]